jgi:hypothetical protein
MHAAIYVYDLKTTNMAEVQNLEILPDTYEESWSVMMEMMYGTVSQKFFKYSSEISPAAVSPQMEALEGN